MHREIEYASKGLFQKVMAARDQGEDFVLIVRGPLAKKLARVAPLYEQYRLDRARTGWRRKVIAFGSPAIRSPLFWGLCILVDFEAKRSRFVFHGDVLRVEFNFQ